GNDPTRRGLPHPPALRDGLQQAFRTLSRLLAPLPVTTENDPGHRPRQLLQEREHGSPTSDLEIVRVCAEAQHVRHRRRPVAKRQRQHHVPSTCSLEPMSIRRARAKEIVSELSANGDRCCLQTSQGGLPCECISSNTCLSLNVSMHFQNPLYWYETSCRARISRRKGSSTSSSPSCR